MHDIPGVAVIDKQALFGACARLPIEVDAQELRRQMQQVPDHYWVETANRAEVHEATSALFLRGFAPADGEKPIEDRPVLDSIPYVRHIFMQLQPATPMRCLFARLPAGQSIIPHIDWAPYFWKTLRLHIPVETNDQVWMLCAGQCYQMKANEVWVLNNNLQHGVWNAHPKLTRTHLICDFLAQTPLPELLQKADGKLGQIIPQINSHFDG